VLKRQGKGAWIQYVLMGVAIITLALGMSSIGAQGVSSIAQGFQTDDENVARGALVSLKPNTPNAVELATAQNLDQIIGVVGENSLIELSNGATTIQVVTSGTTPTLVSDINGAVKTGDKITTSPISGVGMKATTSTLVIGTAQADLAKGKTENRTVTDKSGKQQTVHVGSVDMQVDKVYYQAPQDQNSVVPLVWQDFANRLAGHQVSPVRIMLAALLVGLLLVIIAALLYSAVRSSIISIGRNPLSETAVHKSLLEVGLSVVGLLIFTAIVIYLILTT
jgi:hypothetical protein